MDFECITGQIKSQETFSKLHNENALGSMLTRGITIYNNQQKTNKNDITSFSQYYKWILFYFPSNENWWNSEAYSRIDSNVYR